MVGREASVKDLPPRTVLASLEGGGGGEGGGEGGGGCSGS